jgi:hypothetical protein
MCFLEYFVVVDRQQQIDHLLGYAFNLVHKIQEHIDYLEHQILIVLNSLPEEWMLVRLSLEYRLECLDFNNLADEILLRGNVSMPKKVYDSLKEAQVVWMLLLNSFHGLSRMNLEEMTLMKWIT